MIKKAIALIIAALVAGSALTITPNTDSGGNIHVIEYAAADVTCAEPGFQCGDLEENGTCCGEGDRCCYVPPGRGSCYCVSQGDSCNRY